MSLSFQKIKFTFLECENGWPCSMKSQLCIHSTIKLGFSRHFSFRSLYVNSVLTFELLMMSSAKIKFKKRKRKKKKFSQRYLDWRWTKICRLSKDINHNMNSHSIWMQQWAEKMKRHFIRIDLSTNWCFFLVQFVLSSSFFGSHSFRFTLTLLYFRWNFRSKRKKRNTLIFQSLISMAVVALSHFRGKSSCLSPNGNNIFCGLPVNSID